MNFKAYDILSSLVFSFLALMLLLHVLVIPYDKDMVIAYTAVAFLLGFVMNTLASWMEDFYYWTWGGKPSNRLLEGKGTWKIKFYESTKAKNSLILEGRRGASNNELFSIAMGYANGRKDSRIDDFNAI